MHLESEERPSSTGCCSKNFLSAKSKYEIKELFRLSWPTILSYFLHNSLFMTSLLFAGHLGDLELAAATLGLSFVNMTGVFIGVGLVTGIETLGSQAYGARNYRMVGIVLQRGFWILGVALVLVWAFWLNTDSLLLLMAQEEEVARLAQEFVFIWYPALIADFIFVLLQRYLQTQGIVKPMFYVGIICNVLHVGINFLMVNALVLGFRGVAVSSCATYILFALGTFLYMIVRKLHRQTWPGWSIEGLLDWGPFVKLAIPGMLMFCIDWWSFEVGSFLMGTFGEIQLGAHGILMQWATVVYMIPMGMAIATAVRVGNALGAGDHEGAEHIMKMSIFIISCIGAFVSLVLLSLKDFLGAAFSSNSEVIEIVSDVTPVMVAFGFVAGIQAVCCGIIRGSGRPKIGVIINFFFYDCVGMPLAIVLSFYVFKSVKGLWLGLVAGLTPQVAVYMTVLWCTNWKKQAELARRRIAGDCLIPNGEDTRRGHIEDAGVSWISRCSSLLSVNDNTLRVRQAPDPMQGWICRTSSLLSLNAMPLRTMHRHKEPKILEEEEGGNDVSVATRPTPHQGNKMSNFKKRMLVLQRLLPLLVALSILFGAVLLRLWLGPKTSAAHHNGFPHNSTACGNSTTLLNTTASVNCTL